ncbi:hypothetical protein PAXRUDRAFT_776544 [Paxillus rubicundulus Ve08.2h10]|uniref:Uncharacterized protein n=1 Tax=Paxillus rubicundulus Ve08.2h10 TaxID=930991 RepID=A0A0D0DRK5_9AGAM|nr:hypothetical protein PAXRUDRAFT_776544 [Paxillus rubicundulus Ve08.2h10]
MLAPSLNQVPVIPLSSTIALSLIAKHRVRGHLLGSYPGPVIDFLLDEGGPPISHCQLEKRLILQDDPQVACATATAPCRHADNITPLGQALRLMIKLIDNVADAHPLLKVGWALLSSAHTVSLIQTPEI